MTDLFLGERSWEDDDGNILPGSEYCDQALQDVALYTLVKLGHYSRRQLEDPDDVDTAFAMRLLRADSAYHAAEREAEYRARPKGN